MANATTNGSPALDDVVKQVDEIRTEIAKLNKMLGAAGGTAADDLKSRAKEKLDRLSDLTDEELQALRERADLAGRQFADTVRRQPVAAVGVAAAAGFLAALLLRK